MSTAPGPAPSPRPSCAGWPTSGPTSSTRWSTSRSSCCPPGPIASASAWPTPDSRRPSRPPRDARRPRRGEPRPAEAAPLDGAVIANEFLDALPVHRVGLRGGRFVELFGRRGGRRPGFAEVEAEPSTPALADRLRDEGIALAEGQRPRSASRLDDWVARDVATGSDAGFAIVIDYGRSATELYGPDRRDGTLRAYSGQRAHADPFVAIGRQDLTAHVDFTAVERAAAAAGWRSLGLTTQARFLAGSGFGELYARAQARPDVRPEDYLLLRATAGRLLDPRALGGFRVLVLGRRIPDEATLRGMTYRVGG